MSHEEQVARHIEECSRSLAEQVTRSGAWPAKFRLPEITATEREALRLFAEGVEVEAGAPVRVASGA